MMNSHRAVGPVLQSRLVAGESARPNLDISESGALAFAVAAGTSWLEVNPAAVRTDGGPGLRFLDVTNRQQRGFESFPPVPASGKTPGDGVGHPQAWLDMAGQQCIAKVLVHSYAPGMLEEVLPVVFLDGSVQFHGQTRRRCISREFKGCMKALRAGQTHIGTRCPDHYGLPSLVGNQPENQFAPSSALILEVQRALPRGARRPQHLAGITEVAEGQTRHRRAAALHLVPLWGVATQGDGPRGEETQQAINLISMASYERFAARLRDGTLDSEVQAEIQAEARAFSASSSEDEAVKQALDMRLANWRSDFASFLSATRDYVFPVVRVPQGEFAQVIVIFEAINRSGKPLSTFDLLGARNAKRSPDKKSLASQIVDYVEQLDDERRAKQKASAWSRPNGLMISNQELTNRFKTYFHQGLTLRQALGDFSGTCIDGLRVDDVKKEAALDLDENQISEYWRPVTLAIYESWAFLQERCSVPTEASLRNKLLMIPLVAAHLIPSKKRPRGFEDYLTFWFWSSTLTSRYSSDQNPRCIEDTKRLISWILGQSDGNPFEALHGKVLEDEGYSDLETLLGDSDDDTGTNVGDYLPMFVSSQGGKDLLADRPLRPWEEQLDLHHIIPLGSVTKLGQTARELRRSDDAFGRLMNSPLNLCYLSKESNEKIKAMSLARYHEVLTDSTLQSLRLPLNRDDYTQGASADGSDDAWVKDVLQSRHENIRAAWLELASKLQPTFDAQGK